MKLLSTAFNEFYAESMVSLESICSAMCLACFTSDHSFISEALSCVFKGGHTGLSLTLPGLGVRDKVHSTHLPHTAILVIFSAMHIFLYTNGPE